MTFNARSWAIATVLIMGVAGCKPPQGAECTSFADIDVLRSLAADYNNPKAPPQERAIAGSFMIETCIAQNARLLANSRDTASEVATAVLSRCHHYIRQTAHYQELADQSARNTVPLYSSRTGAETSYYGYLRELNEEAALARVVEARFAKCKPLKPDQYLKARGIAS